MSRNLPLLLVLAAALAALLWIWAADGEVPSEPPRLEPTLPAAPGSAPEPTGPTIEPAAEPEVRVTEPLRQPPPPQDVRLRMVRADDGRPVAGVRAWLGTEALTEPSGEDGWLSLVAPSGQRLTFWGVGWAPAEHLTRALPAEEVALTPADASLEALLDALEPEDGVVHSRLEPLDWVAPSEVAWAGLLEATGPDRLFGQGLAAGRYQLHVWVGPPKSAGVPLPAVEVQLEPGQHAVVRLDASAKPDDEVDR